MLIWLTLTNLQIFREKLIIAMFPESDQIGPSNSNLHRIILYSLTATYLSIISAQATSLFQPMCGWTWLKLGCWQLLLTKTRLLGG